MDGAYKRRCTACSVILLVVCFALGGCGSRSRFEMDKQPREVATGGSISISLTAKYPPPGTRYIWYSDSKLGKCEPAETDQPWTKYTAPAQAGPYRVLVEVKNGGRVLFSDGVDIKVIGREEAIVGTITSQMTPGGSADSGKPAITISQVPAYDPVGGPVALEPIAGEVSGADAKSYRVVVYAFTDNWYVQPFIMAPFTDVEPNGKWNTQSHLGSRYAALLVKPGFHPRNVAPSLPGVGNEVVAVATATGRR